MFRSLLTLLLCLLVLLPQRFCDCAAAQGCGDSTCPVNVVVAAKTQLPSTTAHRCTKHRHGEQDEAIVKTDAPSHSELPANPPTKHHPDCPVVKAPVAGQTLRPVNSSPFDLLTDATSCDLVVLSEGASSRWPVTCSTAPPHVPLYLSLLFLRN